MEFTLAGPPTFNTRATIIIIITQKRTSYKKTQLKIDFVLFSGFCEIMIVSLLSSYLVDDARMLQRKF